MSEPKFVYVTYIATTPEKLWQALTDGAFTRQFWFGTSVESDWSRGSRVIFRSGGEVHDTGEVLDCVPYRRLSYSWQVEFHEVFRREKLHYLNPVPIHELAERWIGKYERHRLSALAELKRGLEAKK